MAIAINACTIVSSVSPSYSPELLKCTAGQFAMPLGVRICEDVCITWGILKTRTREKPISSSCSSPWELPLLSISSRLYTVLPCFLRSCQAVSNRCYFGSSAADASLLWVLQPFCNHALPLCLHVFPYGLLPSSRSPHLAWPPTRPAGHPGCH